MGSRRSLPVRLVSTREYETGAGQNYRRHMLKSGNAAIWHEQVRSGDQAIHTAKSQGVSKSVQVRTNQGYGLNLSLWKLTFARCIPAYPYSTAVSWRMRHVSCLHFLIFQQSRGTDAELLPLPGVLLATVALAKICCQPATIWKRMPSKAMNRSRLFFSWSQVLIWTINKAVIHDELNGNLWTIGYQRACLRG